VVPGGEIRRQRKGDFMRIGIMGGTFDPIHLGHLRAAEEIYWAFDLDKIIFIPSSRPPHKDASKVTPALHRYEMVSLATIFTPYFSVSSIEIDRPGRSYSVETVQEIRRMYGKDSVLYFIIGVDAFLEISTWKNGRELLASVQFIVTARPGWRLDDVERSLKPKQLEKLGNPRIRYLKISEIDLEEEIKTPEEGLVLLVEVVSLDISSTEIRQLVEEGRSIRFLVPDTVAAYMDKNQLYRENSRGKTNSAENSRGGRLRSPKIEILDGQDPRSRLLGLRRSVKD
jgi:nicotinate-nucleotide adenylyltransferase